MNIVLSFALKTTSFWLEGNVTMQWSNTTYCRCKLLKIYDS